MSALSSVVRGRLGQAEVAGLGPCVCLHVQLAFGHIGCSSPHARPPHSFGHTCNTPHTHNTHTLLTHTRLLPLRQVIDVDTTSNVAEVKVSEAVVNRVILRYVDKATNEVRWAE